MAYDIPDEIKYKEKIVANLDMRQLGYLILFGTLGLLIYNLDLNGDLKTVFLGAIAVFGASFVFLNAEEKAKDITSFLFSIRKASSTSQAAQNFFEVKGIENGLICLDNGNLLAVIQVEPVNFKLMGKDQRKVLLENYRSFLNHLSIPVQIIIRTIPVSLDRYFEEFKLNKRKEIVDLYDDFKSFEEDFVEKFVVRKRYFYMAIPFRKKSGGESDRRELEEVVKIAMEKLTACGLKNTRIDDEGLRALLLTYSSQKAKTLEEDKEDKKKEIPLHSRILRNFCKLPGYKNLRKKIDGYSKFFSGNKHVKHIKHFYKRTKSSIVSRMHSITSPINTYLQKANLPQITRNDKKAGEKEEQEMTDDELFKAVFTPSFEIKSDHALVNQEFHRIIRVAGYPRKVEDGWLHSFLSKNEGYDISIHIEPSTIRHMLVYLHNQIIQQSADLVASTMKGTPNPALEIKKADTMRVYDQLYRGEEKLFYVSTYIDNKEGGFQDLNLLTEKCKANLNSLMMVPSPVKWRTADAIKSTIPIACDRLGSRREFLTSPLAATFPFISPVDSREKGILFAHEKDTLNPVFLDFEGMSNKHFFVIGISGSGKSYTSKYLVIQQLFREDTKTFILDPNGEYKALCEKLGGQIIRLSRDSRSTINLFDMAGDDYGNKMLSLVSAFDILCGGITESQKSVLNRALSSVYRKKGILTDDLYTWDRKCPTFSDLKAVLKGIHEDLVDRKDYLQDPSVESLLNRVEMYCKGGIFGFLDNHTKIDVQNRLTCFDLSSLPGAVKPLCMFMVLDLIRREVKKDLEAKIVLIDEGWALLKRRESENYILEFIKTSRKYNTSVGFVTQEIEDLLNSQTGKSILNTASTKILMRQNPSNMSLISKVLHLNSDMESFLLSASKGQGLAISEDGSYKFLVSASPKMHELITTDPKDAVKTKERTEEKKESEEKDEKEKEADKNMKKLLEIGLYLKKDLSRDQVDFLRSMGYVECRERLEQRGGSPVCLVKTRGNESTTHAFLVWSTLYLLKDKFNDVEMPASVGPDVLVRVNKKLKVCFEIETGSNLKKHGPVKVRRKFERLKQEFKEVYIVLADKDDKSKYEHFGEVITRNKIAELVKKLARRYNS